MYGKLIYLFSFIFMLFISSSVFSADDPSLVIYYSFDEVFQYVADQSGKGNDGAVQGNVMSEPNGKLNGAAKFTGGFIGLDGNNFPSEYIPTSAITLAAWVKCQNTGEHHAMFDARTNAGTWIFHPELRSDGQFRWAVRASGMSPLFDIRAGSVTWDQWLHYAGTYDKETGKAVLYVNGQVVSEIDLPRGTDIAADWGDGARVGSNIANTRPLTGLVDEFYLFTRALSHGEIKKLMHTEGWPYASDPSPADDAMHLSKVVNMGWTPGISATSHDVYMGESFDDVNDGAEGTFYGNQNSAFFIAGSGAVYPGGLVPGTRYYWRIDEIAANGEKYEGDVWSFWISPNTAYNPVPADGAKFIGSDVELGWTGGLSAKLHTVYFGENFNDVNNAAGGAPQPGTTYSPGTLELGKTYYWRIDEFGTTGIIKGEVWSFTTAGVEGGIRADYYRGMDLRNHTLSRTDPQINFNWGLSGPDESIGDDNYSVRWTGNLEVPISGTYSFYPKVLGSMRLWINDQLIIDRWQDFGKDERWQDHFPVEYHQAIYLEAGVYPIVMEFAYTQSYGGAAVAVLFWASPTMPRQVIPQSALSIPLRANRPSPANGAVDVRQTTALSWSAGDYAATHQVYFGTDEQAVKNADTGSPEYKGSKELGSEDYDPGKLDWNTTYFWRIDQTDDLNPDSPWIGNVWNFTTADFLIVDDFELYNDYNPSDPDSNRIFVTWKDGLGYGTPTAPPYFAGNGSGAIIGHADPPFAEQQNVHGGQQSMPYEYNNASGLKYSEAEMTLVYPRDWTEGSVDKLVIWYRGNLNNSPDPMYVALNGYAIVFHDNPGATQIDIWTEWIIDLQKFVELGVDLANVNTIALGFGNKNNPQSGGSGFMLFDNIRLYKTP